SRPLARGLRGAQHRDPRRFRELRAHRRPGDLRAAGRARAPNAGRLGQPAILAQRRRGDGLGLGLARPAGHARPARPHPAPDPDRPWRPLRALWRRYGRPPGRGFAPRPGRPLRKFRPRPASRGAGAVQRHPDRFRGQPVAGPHHPEFEFMRRHVMTNTLKLSTALIALTAFASPALAQEEPAPAANTDQSQQDLGAADQEVTVTARRTEENLQNVPAAVSAFSARSLDRIQAQDPTGLQGAVPNLNIVPGRGSSNATNIYIRGVGQPDALQTFDPAVGLYVDGVYYSRIRGTQFDLLDLQRVEVLRGPQGT